MDIRRIILPGEKVAEGRVPMPGAFAQGEGTYAAVVGMMGEDNKFIPLEKVYRPFSEDVVIGMVTDSRHAGYDVDLNLPNAAFISTRENKVRLELGDFVICKVKEVSETGDIDLTEVRRLPKGKLVIFPPAKVPRLIGRQSSMINLVKEHVGDLMVGNNGYVWVSERADMPLAIKAITMIEEQAHFPGLTDRVSALFANAGAVVREGNQI